MAKKDDSKSSLMIGMMAVQIVLLIVVIIQISSLMGSSSNFEDDAEAKMVVAGNAQAQGTGEVNMQVLMSDDPVRGDPDAPVTIVEWSDFQCPFCGRFYRDTLPLIEQNYIDTGKVRLVYRDYPLPFHPQAQKSAEAAECAGDQGMYWEMHDKIFDNQNDLSVDNLKQWAADIGLDTQEFNDCLDSGEKAVETQQDMTAGKNAGIKGTPGFIINGELVSGAQPYAVFEQAIEKALNG